MQFYFATIWCACCFIQASTRFSLCATFLAQIIRLYNVLCWNWFLPHQPVPSHLARHIAASIWNIRRDSLTASIDSRGSRASIDREISYIIYIYVLFNMTVCDVYYADIYFSFATSINASPNECLLMGMTVFPTHRHLNNIDAVVETAPSKSEMKIVWRCAMHIPWIKTKIPTSTT